MNRTTLSKAILGPVLAAFLVLTFVPSHQQTAAADFYIGPLPYSEVVCSPAGGFEIRVPGIQVGNSAYMYHYAYRTNNSAWMFSPWFYGSAQGIPSLQQYNGSRWVPYVFPFISMVPWRGQVISTLVPSGVVEVFEYRVSPPATTGSWYSVGSCNSNRRIV